MRSEKQRMTQRAQREFVDKLHTFEKRSKLITIRSVNKYWGRMYIRVDIVKENKVVNEMIEFFKSVCNDVEIEKDGTMWLRNYDEYNWDDEEHDTWDLEYSICVAKK